MTITEYCELIRNYLDNRIALREFSTRYFAAFLSEPLGMDEEAFLILDALFATIDCCWEVLPVGEDMTFVISEDELRREVHATLRSLKQCLADN